MGAGGSCCQGAGDDERMVTKMDLSHIGCTEVPAIVFQAERYVETLNLSHNRILSLPPQLFHCQELKHLKLIDNGLDSLPPAIGSLLHLVSLKLDKNCIRDLPENLKSCRKLKRLSLSNNQLQQLPGIVTQLISLEELYLNDCDISFLPASVGRLTRLRILELRNNRLCNLPLSMSRITTLSRLDLGDNSFEALPECSTSLGALQELLLDNNDLEIFAGAGLKKLEHLDVSYNNLKSVGKDIGQCTSLTLLNLGWNYLETLPETVSSLVNLEGLVLEMNELTSLPRTLGKMTRLEELNVSNNRLCDLPSAVGLLRNLAVLNISRNYIQELPCELGSCQRLSIMNASYNRLQSLPAEVGYLNNLKVLDLVGNFLMYLPISMSNLTGIRAIWLSANQNVPLIPFTEDVSMASGERFLTNIALPQLGETALPPVENNEPVEKTSWRRKIRFEEDEDLLPGRLDRTPTPFPKELRCPTRKSVRVEENYVNVVDGRVAVFQQAQQSPSCQSYSDSNIAIIREANIRRNKDAKSEDDGEQDSTERKPLDEVKYHESNLGKDTGTETQEARNDEIQVHLAKLSTGELHDRQSGAQTDIYGSAQAQDDFNEEEIVVNDENEDLESLYARRGCQEDTVVDLPYGHRPEREDNGRMSPISEEDTSRTTPLNLSVACLHNDVERKQIYQDVGGMYAQKQNCRNEVAANRIRGDGADSLSIDSFESERRRSMSGSVDNQFQGLEINRNQVIYSNLRNGNVFPQEPRGYRTPPHKPIPNYRNGAQENPYEAYRSPNGAFAEGRMVIDDMQRRNGGSITPNGVRPNVPNRQAGYGIIQQSPYNTQVHPPAYGIPQHFSYGPIRQSPRLVENGNAAHDIERPPSKQEGAPERPPSKQEMLSIAERNLSQNIAPPCYEIAKMYSTKAALFEHCHRPNQS